MNQYHKIQTVFKRNPDTKFKTLLINEYSLPELEFLRNNYWTFTEKVDGTNIRVMWGGGKIKFGGKTDNAQLHADLVVKLREMFDDKLEFFKETFIPPEDQDISVCLYGEGYGAGIQKGGCYRQDKSFVLFDINIGGWWLQRVDVEDIADKLSLDTVPVIATGTLIDMVDIAKSGFESQWGNFTAEGIVARPRTELRTRSGHRIITKIKHKDFEVVAA